MGKPVSKVSLLVWLKEVLTLHFAEPSLDLQSKKDNFILDAPFFTTMTKNWDNGLRASFLLDLSTFTLVT